MADSKEVVQEKRETPSKDSLIKTFKERIGAITKETRIAILHDTDADGISSAVLTSKAIERIRGKPIDYVAYQNHKFVGINKDTLERLKNQKIQTLITLDKPIDEMREEVEEASKFLNIIALDHHQCRNELNNQKILIIKSQYISDIDGSKYPTSKLAYDLFSQMTDISDLDWIASAGVIGDSCYTTWKEFVDNTIIRHGFDMKKDIFDTEIGLASRCIGSAVIYNPRNAKESYDILYKAKSAQEVNNSKLKAYLDEIEAELELWIKEHKTRAQVFPELELIFYVITPRFPINSPLSTILSQKYYPDKTLVVVHDSGDPILGISLRRQDYKIDCPGLVREALSGLPEASGGGHIPAAGGKMRREDTQEFLKKLKKALESGRHRRKAEG